ncbi:MAG: putative squalene/phytoene synthase [Frankiales bacterium]|nr:putative squalene/phytoene synthase [Frankiales bacterium]
MPTPEHDSAADFASMTAIAANAPSQSAAENFPVALRILPRGPRQKLHAAYAYARFVDDVGDEYAGDRLAMLDYIKRDVARLDPQSAPGSDPRLPVVAALAPLVVESGVSLDAFYDLIEANRLDQTVVDYETFADLMEYCRLSANPIGRIVLAVAGRASAQNVIDSDEVCSALQVLEHCQDVGEDARAGRVYLPQRELELAGVARADLVAATATPALRSVILTQVDRAEQMLAVGRRLVAALSGWARIAVAGYVAGGETTAAALRRSGGEVLSQNVRASKGVTVLRTARLAAMPVGR